MALASEAQAAIDELESIARSLARPATPGLLPQQEQGAGRLPESALEGHRTRMRMRLLDRGPDALSDQDLLEMVLFLALPRRDTRALAALLIDSFGGYAQTIAAPANALRAIDGLGEAAVAAIKSVEAAARRLAGATAPARPILSDWDRLLDYLDGAANGAPERLRSLFLDRRNRLIADETLPPAITQHAPLFPKSVVRRAVELHASALILVRDRPSSIAGPSREDVTITRALVEEARELGITLHDHVVVGRGQWFSFRKEGLL